MQKFDTVIELVLNMLTTHETSLLFQRLLCNMISPSSGSAKMKKNKVNTSNEDQKQILTVNFYGMATDRTISSTGPIPK